MTGIRTSIAIQIAAMAILGLQPASIPAQVGTSTLTGKVTDESGAVIPNAEVRIVNASTGVSLTLLTNGEGIYRATALIAGVYRIEARAHGFDPAVRSGAFLEGANTTTADFVLKIEVQTQTIEVTDLVTAVDSQSSSVGQQVNRNMIEDLPMPNRAASSLVTLSPGVIMITTGEGAENYPVFSVAGGRARNQNFTLDGGNVTNAVGVTRPQQQTSLPLEAMQEFRVISNNYSAEYGHSTGGVIALTTRSGTNELHGSIFEFARNKSLDSRNFFAAATPPLNMHQFGGALGGPLKKDKTHYFVSWEETRESFGSAPRDSVPWRRGSGLTPP